MHPLACGFLQDMQLILFNFPFMKGSSTKPNAGRGSAGDAISSWREKEPFIFTFWCVSACAIRDNWYL